MIIFPKSVLKPAGIRWFKNIVCLKISLLLHNLTNLAVHYDADFQFYPKLVASLQQIDRAHVKQFLERTLSRKNTRRLAVFIEGKLPAEHDFSYKSLAKEDVHAIGDFEGVK
jgi:hypothetical protein